MRNERIGYLSLFHLTASGNFRWRLLESRRLECFVLLCAGCLQLLKLCLLCLVSLGPALHTVHLCEASLLYNRRPHASLIYRVGQI